MPAIPPDDASQSDHEQTATDIVRWWHAVRADWFSHRPQFDLWFRARYLDLHHAAAAGALDAWAETADGALALLILLDQFPRNTFRHTAGMYATDAQARRIARQAIEMEFDLQVDPELRLFFYLPFAHSENMADQQLSVALNRRLGRPWLDHAKTHAAIIRRFGRFPHRNALLGRSMTAQEQAFLDQGGFAG